MKPNAAASTRVQAILQLKDGFSGEPVDDASVTFQLDQVPWEPLRKANGFYVFTDLPGASPHQLRIICPGFSDARVTLTAISLPLVKPLAELIVVYELEPGPLYAYPVGTTVVCGQVTSAGKPMADVEVFALFSDRVGTWHWRKTLSYGSESDNDPCHGHYAFALPLTVASTEVNLRYMKDGHAPHFDRVAPIRSMTTIVGADLQPANA